MPKLSILRNLRIAEVSSVDRGAGEGVKVMLMKALRLHEPAPYWDRSFTKDQRDAAATAGSALPDGSFPIKSRADLGNAVRAFGRAADKNKTREHIIARARALSATDLLPATWDGSTKKSMVEALKALLTGATDADAVVDAIEKDDGLAASFAETMGAVQAQELAQGILSEINDAMLALGRSIQSILSDDSVSDKEGMLKATLAQFQEHVQGLVPEELQKALHAAGLTGSHEGDLMTTKLTEAQALYADAIGMAKADRDAFEALPNEERTKRMTDKPITKALSDLSAQVATLTADLAVAKLSPEDREYVKGAKMSPEDAKRFAAMSDADRAKEKSAKPVDKYAGLPEDVQKRLREADDTVARVAKLEGDAEIATLAKRCAAIGEADAFAVTLQKAYRGDKAAIDAIVTKLEAAHTQAKAAGIFKELGTAKGADASPSAQLWSMAKTALSADPKLKTLQKAFDKVFNDPTNAQVREQAKAEPQADQTRAALEATGRKAA